MRTDLRRRGHEWIKEEGRRTVERTTPPNYKANIVFFMSCCVYKCRWFWFDNCSNWIWTKVTVNGLNRDYFFRRKELQWGRIVDHLEDDWVFKTKSKIPVFVKDSLIKAEPKFDQLLKQIAVKTETLHCILASPMRSRGVYYLISTVNTDQCRYVYLLQYRQLST